jgi:predicted site-specific integrase-resolvase
MAAVADKPSWEATLAEWANRFGIDRQTLARSLTQAGAEMPEPHSKVDARTIFKAIVGDKDAEKRRLLRAQAEEKERENRLANKEIVIMPEVEQAIIEKLVQPLGEALGGMAMALGQLCNPSDPESAQRAIEGYIERTIKPHLRERLK